LFEYSSTRVVLSSKLVSSEKLAGLVLVSIEGYLYLQDINQPSTAHSLEIVSLERLGYDDVYISRSISDTPGISAGEGCY
jgi:hypothetical protein